MIDHVPITPLDPIAHRAAGARSRGQGWRPIFREADTPTGVARPENLGPRRSLALGRREHDGRLMGNRAGGLCAAIPVLMVWLIAGTMSVTAPCAASADPPAHTMSAARNATVAVAVDPWASYVAEAARRFAIPDRWIRAVMRVESDHDPQAVSPKGAMGLMQIMSATWQELRIRYRLGDDPYDPRNNVLAGAAYLAELHDLYGSPGFLAAYNAGPGRYEQHLVTGDPLPAETVDYIAKIVPTIDAVAAETYRPARSEWSVAPLFVAHATVRGDGGRAAGDLPSDRPSNRGAIVDLSALAPPSDGLFVHRTQDREARP
ncbi:lytic transglycosylase domain-containing protein [Neorhizobium sp. DT-125]|uniref:lytic transglycosylase domain-containing protein n=1 Tax=Neorhizobium sp. DT-125 TaxID=3396163 RepID=UPI003F1D197F